jgi:hypothetical protein
MQIPMRVGQQLPQVRTQQRLPPPVNTSEPLSEDSTRVPDQKDEVGTLTDAVWASARDLWQALRWTVPLAGESYTLPHLEAPAALKLSWIAEINTLQLAWADGHRLSVATISAHLHEATGEITPFSWVVVLGAKGISLLTATIHRLAFPGDAPGEGQEEILILRRSPEELLVTERGAEEDQIMASSLFLPVTPSFAPTTIAPFHPPVALFVIEHAALQEALTWLDQEWVSLHSHHSVELPLPQTIGFRLDGRDTANLTCFIGPLDTRTAVEISAEIETFSGPAITLHLDRASLQQVLTSAGNDVASWEFTIGNDAERIQILPKDNHQISNTPPLWCHELYIVE